jgi:hypothetical protein
MPANFPHPSLDKGSLELTEEYIRLRAYQLWEERGCEHGYHFEDWLRAEEEILGAVEFAALTEEHERHHRAAA